ncbi:MAG: hypothetical protein Q7R33_01725 [Nitrosarchaeum sp.]|nr:hypothetical protein [Nitrosarchaeum sp.]
MKILILLLVIFCNCAYHEIYVSNLNELASMKIDKQSIRHVDTLRTIDGRIYRVQYK